MASTPAPARVVQLLASLPHWLVGRRASRSAAEGRLALVRLAVVGGVAGVAVAWAVAGSTMLAHPVATGVLRGAVVASAVAVAVTVGCHLAYRRPESRFGLLLAANGFLFGMTALNAASDAVVFTLGRVVNLALWSSLVYLFLAFPGDTIRSARERRIVYALGVATVAAWMPTFTVFDRLPACGHFVNCIGACPANGLQVATVPGDAAAVRDA